jgi:carbamoyltransferase
VIILGINGGKHAHDDNICVLKDGEILGHWELERHYRIKHFNGSKNEIGLFLHNHVLPKLSLTVADIDVICFPSIEGNGRLQETEFNQNIWAKGSDCIEKPYVEWEQNWCGKNQKFCAIQHHVNHMAYGYYCSPFSDAISLAWDGLGDFHITTTYSVCENSNLNYISNFRDLSNLDIKNNFIGMFFYKLNMLFPFLGFNGLEVAGKAMALASYGKPQDEFKSLIKDTIFAQDIQEFSNNFDNLLSNLKIPNNTSAESEFTQNFLSSLQEETENYLLDVVNKLSNYHNKKNICISGGCALNICANTKLVENGFNSIFIPPACNDGGQSIGEVLYYWYNILDNNFTPKAWHNPYLGDELEDKEAIITFKDDFPNFNKREFFTYDSMNQWLAKEIVNGKIVAWVQGRSEVGPRALGNRSILMSPCYKERANELNLEIKKREWYRPFAPICLAEFYKDWFDIDHEQPYMLESPKVKEEVIPLISAVVHCDKTARIQTLRQEQNPILYNLIKNIYKTNKIPIVLNTSLNSRGVPIFNYAKDVLQFVHDTKIDYAVIGNNVLFK